MERNQARVSTGRLRSWACSSTRLLKSIQVSSRSTKRSGNLSSAGSFSCRRSISAQYSLLEGSTTSTASAGLTPSSCVLPAVFAMPTTAPGLASFVSPARLAASVLASLAAVLPLVFTLSTLAPLAPVAPLVPVALAPAAASTLAPAPAPSVLPPAPPAALALPALTPALPALAEPASSAAFALLEGLVVLPRLEFFLAFLAGGTSAPTPPLTLSSAPVSPASSTSIAASTPLASASELASSSKSSSA